MIVSTYFTWLLVFILIPSFLLLIKFWKVYLRYPRTLLAVVGGSFIFGFPWTALATGTGVWFFNRNAVLGIWILNLPLEEVLFLVVVPVFVGLLGLILIKK